MTSREGFKGAFASTVIVPGPNGQILIYAASIPNPTNLVMALSALSGTDSFGTPFSAGIDLGYNWQMGIQWDINRPAGHLLTPAIADVVTDSDHESFGISGPWTSGQTKPTLNFVSDHTVPKADASLIADTLNLTGNVQTNVGDGAHPIVLGSGVGTGFKAVESGSGTLVFSGGASSATLNIAFTNNMPSASYQILLGVAAITGNTVVSASWFNKATTGFSLVGRVDNGNVFTGNVTVDWMVIGG